MPRRGRPIAVPIPVLPLRAAGEPFDILRALSPENGIEVRGIFKREADEGRGLKGPQPGFSEKPASCFSAGDKPSN
jgi:hypothetical protein